MVQIDRRRRARLMRGRMARQVEHASETIERVDLGADGVAFG